MKLLLSIAAIFIWLTSSAKDSTIVYNIPDSITAVSLIAEVNISSINTKKEVYAGIQCGEMKLSLQAEKKEREVEFEFPSSAMVLATGLNVEKENDEIEWKFNWKENTNYKLLIATAADSAGNFVLYSGYIWLPEEQKWKLIGTCKVNGTRDAIKQAATFSSPKMNGAFANVWIQRSAGSWKRLDSNNNTIPPPSINPLVNVDSVQQYDLDKQKINTAIAAKQTDVDKDTAGVYYKIIDAGSGKQVFLSDTVTVHYKLKLFGTDEIFQQTDKPATFPLNRLIKGWQLVIPLVRTGGKVKIVIPSGLAYSIRTRSPQIPPNSILEFEVEVLDTKPAVYR